MEKTFKPSSKSASKIKGKLLYGRLYDRNPNQPICSGSIPTRFQRILMPPNTTLIQPDNRLNPKCFYKTLYNKDPGPGTYTLNKETIDDNPSISKSGYGVGFASKSIKSSVSTECSVYSNLGPGRYNPEKPQSTLLASKVFTYSGRKELDTEAMLKLNLPFDEKNPLNYIKPIALNVYIKPTVPGPGEYNIENSKVPNNMSAVVFKSEASRVERVIEDTPGVGHYFVESKKEVKKPMKRSKTNKKIRYDWLGEEAELLNKSYTEQIKQIKKKSKAEIINYGKLYAIQKSKSGKEKLEVILENPGMDVNPTAAFMISDMDRFGFQMRHKRPFEVKPGPADYDIDSRIFNRNKGYTMSRSKSFTNKRKLVLPGPAFYNPRREPEKLSFHLNLNKHWI